MDLRLRNLVARALISVAVVLGTAAIAHAQTFPVTATVEFETGLRKLATVTLSNIAIVDWGDGTSSVGLLVDCRGLGNFTCDVYGTHTYGDFGVHTITIRYSTPVLGLPASVTTTASVVPVGDFVVLSIGDSVGSGEGNPVVERSRVFFGPHHPITQVFLGLWDDEFSNYGPKDGCHRTAVSGPALATGGLKSTNPTSGITFIHVACSGADIGDARIQLRDARKALERARIDAGGLPGGDPINVDVLLISAGGNNIQGGFGNLVQACAFPFSDCSTLDLSDDFAAMPGQYQLLADSIVNPIEGSRGTVSKVYISEYYDATRDQFGDFPTLLNCPLGGLEQDEWEFLYNDMIVPLNDAIAAAAAAHGWHVAGGIESAFRTHGYCAPAADRWIVSLNDSTSGQGEQLGTGHPNLTGQAAYRDSILNTVIFFTPPETTASAIAGGQPYPFGTWTPHDVVVSLVAQNPISQSGVGKTFFAVDDPTCTPQSRASCSIYTVPFVISTSGAHAVSFFSENQFEQPERMQTVLVRIDKDPPKMTCVPTPEVLWAPNGKLVPVAIAVTAVDDVSGPAPFVLSSVATSEGSAAEDILEFETGGPDVAGLLRARRFGFGPGRQYGLTYQSADALGNVGTCTAIVTVPHDQGQKK